MTTDLQIDELLQEPEVADRYVRYMKFSLLLHLYAGAERRRQIIFAWIAHQAAVAMDMRISPIQRRKHIKRYAAFVAQAHKDTRRSRDLWHELKRMYEEVAP